MNKIASILFLETLGLCRVPIYFVNPKNSRSIKNFYSGGQWVVRCGNPPGMCSKMEGWLPWGVGNTFDELIGAIHRVHKQSPEKIIFIHRQREIAKSGNILISFPEIIVEGNVGSYRRMANYARGKFNPDAIYHYRPGCLTLSELRGKNIFSREELYEITRVERILPYQELNVLSKPISLEFSVNKFGYVDFHDISIHD